MGAAARAMIEVAAALGAVWVHSRRRRYRRVARPLSAAERRDLAGHFAPALLDAARVAEVDRVEDPWFLRALRARGLGRLLDPSTVGGMAFGDVAVLVRGLARPRLTLFHELVHLEQYRALGVRRFVREYLRGWAENGREYRAIPLEAEAFARTERYAAGTER